MNGTSKNTCKDDYTTCMKIMRAKKKLQKMPLKMTGHNNYNNYDYFELKDITEPITECLLNEELASKFFFTENKAILRIYSENGYCEWETPLKYNATALDKAKSGKDQGVLMKLEQMIQTYARRTLWLQSMEVIEHIELEQPNTQKTPKKSPNKPTRYVSPVKPVVEKKETEITEQDVKEALDTVYNLLADHNVEFTVEKAMFQLRRKYKNYPKLIRACENALKLNQAKEVKR